MMRNGWKEGCFRGARGAQPLEPPHPWAAASCLTPTSYTPAYLFTQLHSGKGECLQVGVRAPDSWGHSFSQKLLHVLAQEGPDLGHDLEGAGDDCRRAACSHPLKPGSWREWGTWLGLAALGYGNEPHLVQPFSLLHVWKADLGAGWRQGQR